MNKYDVVIVGAGPAGIFAAYEFTLKAPHLSVLLVDKGLDIIKRRCPILEKKIEKCPPAVAKKEFAGCLPACSITNGFGGAGAYSDGKFNITTEFGGWMTDYLSDSEVLDLIKYVDAINLSHGATENITDPTTEKVREIERKGLEKGLKLLKAQVRHLGTEQNLEILKKIATYLESKIEMRFRTEVKDILVTKDSDKNKKINGIVLASGEEILCDNIIIVPGRDGSAWFTEILKKYKVSMINNQVDIGVRVETANQIMEEINTHLYEGKFIYKTQFGTTVRTFCSNPSGHVVVENHSGIMAANGHAYKDKNLGSKNTNFALLVSHKFTTPFNKPNEYARLFSTVANDLSNGSVIVQSYGDILKGRRSTPERIKECFIEPTLKEAIPGDLGLSLSYVTMRSIIEMIQALDHVTPGIASDHTLLYGIEAKFYSARPQLTKEFETEINGLWAGGDGAGVTRGLAQASASGVWIARNIMKNLK
jgi:uncharacterized FAD-dependent dehydrogenase